MQTFDQSLFDLYSSDLITFEEALAQCSNPDEFKLRVRGILSAAEMTKLEMEEKKKAVEQAKTIEPKKDLLGLGIDIENPGDQIVEFEGSKVLMVEQQLATRLEGVTIDVEVTEEGAKLVLVEK